MDTEEKSPGPSPDSLSGATVIPSPVPPNAPQDHRAYPRYAVDEAAVLLVVNHGLSLDCRILDLSLKGCRLRILQPFALAEQLRVEVAFKVNGAGFRFLGFIQWTRNDRLIGIRFSETVARRVEQLADVLSEIEAAVREKAAEQAARILAAEVEAAQKARAKAEAENSHRAEIQQIARKPSATQQAAALLSSSNQSAQERRVHARHHVDAMATIVLVKTGSRLKGRIVDLSVSGCRIRAEQRLPVGVYTRIETEFQFGGLSFLLGGVIQNMHDPQTIGIRFLDVSERKREQLQQLIAELAEHEANKPGH